MKWLLHKIGKYLAIVKDYLIAWGVFGLFAISLLDATFVPIPGGPDAALIVLSASRPAWWPIYVLVTTLGSLAGTVILYFISRRAGRRALKRFSEAKQARVKELIDRYDMLSVLVVSLLPPPAPFKLFVISTGVFRFDLKRLVLAILIGRSVRYIFEGYLAAHYGEQAKDLISRYYPAIGIGLAVLVILFFIAQSLWRRRSARSALASDITIEPEG